MRALTLAKIKDFDWLFSAESFSVMNTELMQVLRTQQGIERIDSFLACLWEHLNTAAAAYFECDREEMSYGILDLVETHMKVVLTYYIMGFVDDIHREHIVRCHAQNMTTTFAVYDLIETYPDIVLDGEPLRRGPLELARLLIAAMSTLLHRLAPRARLRGLACLHPDMPPSAPERASVFYEVPCHPTVWGAMLRVIGLRVIRTVQAPCGAATRAAGRPTDRTQVRPRRPAAT